MIKHQKHAYEPIFSYAFDWINISLKTNFDQSSGSSHRVNTGQTVCKSCMLELKDSQISKTLKSISGCCVFKGTDELLCKKHKLTMGRLYEWFVIQGHKVLKFLMHEFQRSIIIGLTNEEVLILTNQSLRLRAICSQGLI